MKSKSRIKTVANIYSKKFECIDWCSAEFAEAFNDVEASGCWLIWGQEKNGKTRFALMLANELTKTARRVLYISAEEGISRAFVKNCKISGIETGNKRLQFETYISYDELLAKLNKQRSPDVVIIDNCTIYNDEITKKELKQILSKYKHKIFVFVAHEERNEPYTALARMCKKLANVIVYVEGLACMVNGRVKSSNLIIDENIARIYYGINQLTQ
jgi:predicted ATP-dependent serine protease